MRAQLNGHRRRRVAVSGSRNSPASYSNWQKWSGGSDPDAAEQRDELAPPHHSITSSARASRVGEISRPSALAAVRLITRSNLVGWLSDRIGRKPLMLLRAWVVLSVPCPCSGCWTIPRHSLPSLDSLVLYC